MTLSQKMSARMEAKSELIAGANAIIGGPALSSIYHVECVGPDGKVKWTETVHNLVTNQGLDDILSKYFKGSSYTAAFYVGLKGTGSAIAGDTLASHSGWSEINPYSGNRPSLTLGSVSGQSVDNSASKASFTITSDTTVYGAFVANAASGTTGVLYGAADFGSARAVLTDDVLNVTITLTAAAS